MIRAKFRVGEQGLITGFCVSGHSGSAESGEDIICAAVSSPVYMTANTLTEILSLSPEITEKDGYFRLTLSNEEAEKASDILQGFFLHLQALSEQYPDFIQVERRAL